MELSPAWDGGCSLGEPTRPEIVEIVVVKLDDLRDPVMACPLGAVVRVDLGRRGLLPMDRLRQLRQFVRGASRVELVGSRSAVRDAAGFLRAMCR